ncbi:hypothetical protein ARMGADRAFT_1005600 [Armillaria gallica]|uniref:AMP-activated protein kinase glycogen-binding domain-containing protein n=1 Tax=Armillaria gallica TaxID=47427 RepID=A0A2H3E7P9_ARMGA|nr:hypothetical protein ARMGADRAFT_1005600 [Armillaria gallica]
MWTLGYWIHERLEGVLFQPVASILFWIGKQMQRHLAFNSTWYNLLPSSSTANMQNNHEVIFEWPHTEPTTVVVTGTFDQWSSSIHLAKDSNGFKGSTQIPWDGKIAYKFIVDGQWTIAPSQPTETDSSGNVNNIYIAPSKPSPPTTTMSKITEKPVANGDTPSSDKQETEASGGVSQVVSDLATAATAGTAAGLGYVASGVGAAIQTVVGEDPEKATATTAEVPAPEPISKAVSEPTPVSAPPEPAVEETLPEPVIVSEPASAEPIPPVVETPPTEELQVTPEPVSEPEPTSVETAPVPLVEPAPVAPAVAPIIPIAIVPVNAAENNESPPPSAETKEEASTHRPSSFSSTPVPPAPAVVAAEVPPAPAEVPPAPVEVPAPASAEPAVALTSSDVIEDMKSTPETASEKPPTSGPAAEEDKPLSQPQLATPPPTAPSTPKKKEAFPSTESPSNSPASSSKFGTPGSARKKRSSIFGKINIKHMFSPSKDKDKEKK